MVNQRIELKKKEEYLELLYKVLSVKLRKGGAAPHKEKIRLSRRFKEMKRDRAKSKGALQ